MSTGSTKPPPGSPVPRRAKPMQEARPAQEPQTEAQPSDSPLSPLPSPHDAAPGVSEITLRLPIASPPNTQVRRIGAMHVDVQFRDGKTRSAFSALWAGLDASGARLQDGRRIVTGADTIRWMFEQIAAKRD